MPGKKTGNTQTIERIERDIEKIKAVIRKICHYSGNERILMEFGFKRWEPKDADMTVWKKEV